MNKLLWLFLLLVLVTSCVTSKGVGRIKEYNFSHPDIPASFDGYRIAFISDLHYQSRFTEKRLRNLTKTLNKLHPDVLLMGGDYHEGCQFVPGLFSELAKTQTIDGKYAVLGNNDYEDCYAEVIEAMKQSGVKLLEHQLDTINRDGSHIILAGVRNPFDLKHNGVSPTLPLADGDFVILLVHTPDYAEDVPITNTDLVLAGHTHGGQVTVFGLYAPVIPSKYGQRFRTGLKKTSAGIPVIITNGIGTSNKNIRMFAPSEVVLIRLQTVTR